MGITLPYVPGIAGENSGQTGTGGTSARRPYDQNANGTGTLGQNIYLITNQTASYHSLQIAAGRPFSRNISVNGFFVWSHAIQSSNESAIGQMTAQDFANLWEEKGPMDVDRRNVATISGMWKLDYFHGQNFLMKQVVNGWTISPVWVMQSGQPINLGTGSNNNLDSANANRPDFDAVKPVSAFLDPHRSRAQSAAQWFNTAAFVGNGPGVAGGIGPGGADGNVPRDYVRAPGYRDVDLGLFRDFKFWENVTFQLRGEATNVFNLSQPVNARNEWTAHLRWQGPFVLKLRCHYRGIQSAHHAGWRKTHLLTVLIRSKFFLPGQVLHSSRILVIRLFFLRTACATEVLKQYCTMCGHAFNMTVHGIFRVSEVIPDWGMRG